MTDPLFVELTSQAGARLHSGEWTVLGITGSVALQPIAAYLRSTFEVERLTDIVVIVCRRDARPTD